MTALTLVRTTFPDRNSAMDAVEPILTARLAACANLSEIASLYHWDGALQEEGEIAVLFKTRAALVAQLTSKLILPEGLYHALARKYLEAQKT